MLKRFRQSLAFRLGALYAGLFALALGQTVQTDAEADKVEAEIAEIQAATPHQADTMALEGERRRLASFREIEGRTSPLTATGAAIGIIARK